MNQACVRASALADWRSTLLKSNGRFTTWRRFIDEINFLLAGDPPKIDLVTFVDLVERIGRASGDSSLAWSIGQSTRYSLDGDFGKAILGCKTLGSTLHYLSCYFPLVQDASFLKLEVNDGWARLSYKILNPGIWPRYEDAMYSLGIYGRLIKTAAPDAWPFAQLTLETEAGRIRPELSALVQAEILYGGNANSIRFPASALDARLNLAPDCGTEILNRLSRELTRKTRSIPLSERTRRMIYTEIDDGGVSQERIARALGVSSRTLRRRLSSEGLSFQALLDECRMQFAALEFRTRRRLSLSDMALKLGYSEHSTFSRAFSRWAGMAPREYRRTLSAHQECVRVI